MAPKPGTGTVSEPNWTWGKCGVSWGRLGRRTGEEGQGTYGHGCWCVLVGLRVERV